MNILMIKYDNDFPRQNSVCFRGNDDRLLFLCGCRKPFEDLLWDTELMNRR